MNAAAFFILTTFLISSLLSILYYKNTGKEPIAMFIISFSIIAISVGIYIHIEKNNTPYNEVEIHDSEIISIKRDKDMEGDFFLGSGQINSENYYYFYENTNYGVKLGKIKTENTYIIETDERSPEIVSVHRIYYNQGFFNFNKTTKTSDECGCMDNRIRTILYVPKGTIVSEFSLN